MKNHKVCYISRDKDHCLAIWRHQPKRHKNAFVDHREISDNIEEVDVEAYWTFGLPHEPAIGTCWVVRWIPTDEYLPILRISSRRQAPDFIPIAHDITHLIEEK